MTDKQKKVLYRIIATALLYAVLLVPAAIPHSLYFQKIGKFVLHRQQF